MTGGDLSPALSRAYPPSGFVIIDGKASWRRCDLGGAVLTGDMVQLAWDEDKTADPLRVVTDPQGAGLAFDQHCQLFHSIPGEARIERVAWGALDPPPPGETPEAVDFIGVPAVAASGDFTPAAPPPPEFTPRALACDGADHLFVLDTRANAVCVFDLEQRRLLRRAVVPAGAQDIAWYDGWLYGVSHAAPSSLWRLKAAGGLARLPVNLSALGGPGRLAFDPGGRLFILDRPHTLDAALFEAGHPRQWLGTARKIALDAAAIAHASGIACAVPLPPGAGEEAPPPVLVVARRANEAFVRLGLPAAGPISLIEPLTARAYDGMGIVATPSGRVAYWTAKGPRQAVAARVRYHQGARIASFRLDSGKFQTVWGRILLDACIPNGTGIGIDAAVSDEDGPDTAASLPADGPGRPVFRRSDGSEQPWITNPASVATYEAPAPARRGRYLWVILYLRGTARVTPKLWTLRAERQGHDWLRRLPQLYSRHERMRDFLQRYLAPAAGLIEDSAVLGDTRHALLKPASAPAEVLPWLAGWVGLALDERWPERARRTMLREAVTLFRLRGTIAGLRRMLEIVTGSRVVIIEAFRMRGLGRAGAGGDGWEAPAVLGYGLRVGGPAGAGQGTGGQVADGQAAGTANAIEDSFARWAHRFTVVIVAELSPEQEAAARHLLDVHRPAHTLADLCTAGAGMRVGLGLQLEMTSIISRGSGWRRLRLGAGLLSRDQVLGRPAGGLAPGIARLGVAGSRLG